LRSAFPRMLCVGILNSPLKQLDLHTGGRVRRNDEQQRLRCRVHTEGEMSRAEAFQKKVVIRRKRIRLAL
jgi:hypothetical protein